MTNVCARAPADYVYGWGSLGEEMPMQISAEIFRAYDIRGVVGEQITEDVIRTIARAYVAHFPQPQGLTVVVGRDLRSSSEALAQAAVAGLISAGCNVIDIGQAPTPLLYFAIGAWEADGGLMITASHKPPEFNGIKLREGEWPFYGDQLQRLAEDIITGDYADKLASCNEGTYTQRDIYEHYFEIAATQVNLQRPIKVVLDLGNGCGTLTAPRLLKLIGADLQTLFEEPDGTFPNRSPDPLHVESVVSLAETVVATGAELGIAIDADGDRIAVVDHQGEMVWPDAYVLPICHSLLEMGFREFVTEVRCSQSLIDDVQQRGGVIEMRACGYPYILEGMRDIGAAMGFETTGHCYFHNPYIKFDDATFAAARLLESLAATDKPLRQIVAEAPVYYTSEEERRECPDEHKFRVAESVAETYAADHDMLTVDGARISFPDGWALIRASNTGEELVMRWEGNSPTARDAIGEQLLSRVQAALDHIVGRQ
jgi:phosphomannomutase / phosphoglucomutase